MRSIHVYPTFRCNMDCLFCIAGGQKRAKITKDIPVSEVISFLDRLNIGPDCKVTISGGEPTLYKDMISLIEHISKKGAIARCLSNGLKFSNFNFALEVVDAGLTEISTNFYAHNSKTYDYLTRTKNNFEKLIAGTRNLFTLRDDYGYPLGIELKILVTRPIMPYIHKIVELISLEFPKPNYIGIFGMSIIKSAKENIDKIGCRLSEASPHIKKAIDVARSFDRDIIIFNIPLCILGGRKFIKYVHNDSAYIDSQIRPDKKNILGFPFDVTKASQCANCIINKNCIGIRTHYAKEYGFDELKPILS